MLPTRIRAYLFGIRQTAAGYQRVLNVLGKTTVAVTDALSMLARDWLIPLTQREYSGHFRQNFLFRCGRIYVMDNHRAALWCWLRHLPAAGTFDLIHIDRHNDCLASCLDDWVTVSQDVATLSLAEYLSRAYKTGYGMCPIYRWDNFLSLFIRHYGSRLHQLYMAVHPGAGDKPERSPCHIDPLELPTTLEYYLERDEAVPFPTIIDIDLDYFTFEIRPEEHGVMFSDEYLGAVGEVLGCWLRAERCICATIALSPECCGGWSVAERVLSMLSEASGHDLRL